MNVLVGPIVVWLVNVSDPVNGLVFQDCLRCPVLAYKEGSRPYLGVAENNFVKSFHRSSNSFQVHYSPASSHFL